MGFIAPIVTEYTCRVTILFLDNNQFTTVSRKLLLGNFITATLHQWELLNNEQKTLQPLGGVKIFSRFVNIFLVPILKVGHGVVTDLADERFWMDIIFMEKFL
jgi:hypothetical protein